MQDFFRFGFGFFRVQLSGTNSTQNATYFRWRYNLRWVKTELKVKNQLSHCRNKDTDSGLTYNWWTIAKNLPALIWRFRHLANPECFSPPCYLTFRLIAPIVGTRECVCYLTDDIRPDGAEGAETHAVPFVNGSLVVKDLWLMNDFERACHGTSVPHHTVGRW